METISEIIIRVENEHIDKYKNKNIELEQQLNNINMLFNISEKVKNNKGYKKGQTYFDFL